MAILATCMSQNWKKVGYMDMDSLLIEFVNCDDFEGWITKSSESLVH
jgi:hypothetical protein